MRTSSISAACIEVICSIAALFLVVPAHGALGAAWVVAISLTSIRGVYLAAVMCRVNALSIGAYLDAIYTRALASAVPAVVVALALRRTLLPGRNWFELITAAALVALVYFAVAFFAVLDPGIRQWVTARMPGSAWLRRHTAWAAPSRRASLVPGASTITGAGAPPPTAAHPAAGRRTWRSGAWQTAGAA